ncbi:MAG: hypothetical protein HXS54_01755 [Theionarchaea archaeon]|nr:hypothetical protein [Theionarchaea archaeon]
MKDYSEDLGNFLEEYVNARSISFLREEPHVLASRISTIISSLFFPSTDNHFLDTLKEKALYELFITVIDDTIEYTDRGKENIFDSLQVITKYTNGVNYNGKGREYLHKSLGCLKKIDEIDITHISAAFVSIFGNYPGPRMFSPPLRKEAIS